MQPETKPSYAELEAEVVKMREAMTACKYAEEFLRFTAFHGLENDECPCCGGRVVIEDSDVHRIEDGRRKPQGKRLRAVPWS